MASQFHSIRNAALLSAASIALLTGSAFAQEAAIEEVVVTGTLIRGVAPVGANVVGISRADIEASGLNDSNMILGTLPQSNFFMSLPEAGGGVAAGIMRFPLQTPNLRGVGGTGTGSGQGTLVLLNGNRIVPMGIETSQVDAGVIPSGIVERTEIVLDGTSAIYGSDAVGGTINYIPRRRIEITEGSVQYGFADSYYQVSANATSGKSWETGGVGFAYSFAKNSNVFQKDRPYSLPENWFEGRRSTGTLCEGYTHASVGTGATLRRFVMTPTGVSGERTDWCDSVNELNDDFTQARESHGGVLSFSQDITENLKFDLFGNYSWRYSRSNNGPFTATATVRSTNPYFRSLTAFGVTNATAQSVGVDFGPLLGYDTNGIDNTSEYGQVSTLVTATVGEWELRLAGAYGKSKQQLVQQTFNSTTATTYFSGTTLTTALNPYDITQSQNRALVGDLVWNNLRYGIHNMMQARAIADGPVFELPGGTVRAAFGGEWTQTKFRKKLTDASTHILNQFETSARARQKALFGEVNVPIVGPDNRMPFVESLTLSASGRWDSYEVYGSTFNPKIGATWEPVDWVSVRGNWGTSFRAPHVVERLGAESSTMRCIGSQPGCVSAVRTVPIDVLPLGLPAGPNVYITMDGTSPNVRPETSDNISFGVDIRPPWVEGLSLSASYYQIDYTDQINQPLPGNSLDPVFRFTPQIVVMCAIPNTYAGSPPATVASMDPGCPARIDAFVAAAGISNGQEVLNTVRSAGYQIVYVIDGRNVNLGSSAVAGLDYSLRYTHSTDWGSITGNVNGTCTLKDDSQIFPGTPVVHMSDNTVKCARFTVGLGATYGDFNAQATLQHRAGSKVNPSANRVPDQLAIDQFDLVNLSFRWNVNGEGPLTQDLRLTLTINNVFDSHAPFTRTTTGGTSGGSTLGRYVQFGINKQF